MAQAARARAGRARQAGQAKPTLPGHMPAVPTAGASSRAGTGYLPGTQVGKVALTHASTRGDLESRGLADGRPGRSQTGKRARPVQSLGELVRAAWRGRRPIAGRGRRTPGRCLVAPAYLPTASYATLDATRLRPASLSYCPSKLPVARAACR